MDHHIMEKIKDLNAKRAEQQKMLKNIKNKLQNHHITEHDYEKFKLKHEKKIEKIKDQIRKLENQI